VGRASAILPAALALAAAANLWKTQSKGAAAALGIALAVWWIGRSVIAPRRRLKATTVAISVWAGFAAICAGVVGVLAWNPSALGLSMRFRWLYWQGAVEMLRHEGLWGVGAGNFGRFFTRYKPLICPEDVQDPHSWIVRATTEWGALGLLALIAIMIGWSWRTARAQNEPRASASGQHGGRDEQRTSGTNQEVSRAARESQPSLASARGSSDSLHATAPGDRRDAAIEKDPQIGRSIGIWTSAIFAAVILTWTLATSGGGFIAWQTSVGVGAACFLACFILASIERRGAAAYSDAPWPCDPWALCAGLFGFILHAGVDLELFWAGPATTAFALAAIVQAMLTEPAFDATNAPASGLAAARLSPAPSQGEGRGEGLMEKNCRYPIVALVVMMAGLTAIAMLWKPLVKTSLVYDIFLNSARISDRPVEMDAYRLSNSNECYQKAVRICERDGTAHDEWTGELTARAATTADCDRILALVAQWRPLDPHDSAVDQREAMVLARRYGLSNDLSDLRASIKAMRRVVDAYPTSPVRRMTLGQLYEKLADDTKDATARADAAREYQAALDCDAGRILVSKPNRFTDEQRAALAARIAALSTGR